MWLEKLQLNAAKQPAVAFFDFLEEIYVFFPASTRRYKVLMGQFVYLKG